MYKLALSMIVKNEAPNIERCLESVSTSIDYYVICDTGSTDNTKEIIKNFFDKKGIPGEILDHPWEDFGTNRSKALEACEGKAEWALMIDADDFIKGKIDVNKFNNDVDGYVVKISRGEFTWYRAQVFHIGKTKWWYEEPLHEYAICRQPMRVEKLEGDYVWEVRTEGCRSRMFENDIQKYKNDYEVLKKHLEKNPKSSRKQFYAAQSAFDARMFDIAEQEYLKRIELGEWLEEVFFCWVRIGICREILGKPIEQVADAFMRAFETKPDRAEPLYHLSCIYRKHNRPRNAFLVALQGLNIPVPQNDILFVDHNVYRWGILDEIATTAFYVGQMQLGHLATEKLLKEKRAPAEHLDRIRANKDAYEKAMAHFNEQMAKNAPKVQLPAQIPAYKTTLDINPQKVALKL